MIVVILKNLLKKSIKMFGLSPKYVKQIIKEIVQEHKNQLLNLDDRELNGQLLLPKQLEDIISIGIMLGVVVIQEV